MFLASSCCQKRWSLYAVGEEASIGRCARKESWSCRADASCRLCSGEGDNISRQAERSWSASVCESSTASEKGECAHSKKGESQPGWARSVSWSWGSKAWSLFGRVYVDRPASKTGRPAWREQTSWHKESGVGRFARRPNRERNSNVCWQENGSSPHYSSVLFRRLKFGQDFPRDLRAVPRGEALKLTVLRNHGVFMHR